jgi:hypothetical protein
MLSIKKQKLSNCFLLIDYKNPLFSGFFMYRMYGQKTAPAFFAYQPSMAIYAAGAGSAGAAMYRIAKTALQEHKACDV